MSRVELTISYAVLKKSYDIVGKMENYVHVRVLGAPGGVSEYKTKLVEGDKDVKIVWNETFTVLDEDATSDDVCGVGLLNLNTTGVFNGANKYNIRLHDEKSQEISGELHITTRYV